MGYSIDVDAPHLRTHRTFSYNISHGVMRRALDAVAEAACEMTSHSVDLYDVLPYYTLEALHPGHNGVTVKWLEAAIDAPKMRAHADAAELCDFPEAWALRVVADALTYATANQANVHFS